MKKTISLLTAIVVTSVIALTNANADPSEMIINVANPNGKPAIAKGYEANEHLSKYQNPVSLTSSQISTILSYLPETGENSLKYKVEVTPTLPNPKAGTTYTVATMEWSADYTGNIITGIKEKLDNGTSGTNVVAHATYLYIEFSTDGGETWNNTLSNSKEFDGSTSLEDAIKAETSKTTLVYGKDYRFSANNTMTVIGWKYKTEQDNKEVDAYEYVTLTPEINFAISSSYTSYQQYFYPDLTSAEGDKTIWYVNINDDTTLTQSLELKKSYTIKEGATITVPNGTTLTNSGHIENNGTIAATGTGKIENKQYITNNGTITSEGDLQNTTHKVDDGEEYSASIDNNGTIAITGKMINKGNIYNEKTITVIGGIDNQGSFSNWEGATFTGDITGAENSTIANYGTVNGDLISDGDIYNVGTVSGTITDSQGNTFHKINVKNETEDLGIIGALPNTAAVGKIIRIFAEEKEGYEPSLTVTYQKDGKTITIELKKETDEEYGITYYTFEMPDADVEIVGKLIAVKNPNTLDNISIYFTGAIVSLLGLAGASIYLKKRTNN